MTPRSLWRALDPVSRSTVLRTTAVLALLLFAAALPLWRLPIEILRIAAALAALASATLALIGGERVNAPVLNRWDEAMLFAGLHLLCRLIP